MKLLNKQIILRQRNLFLLLAFSSAVISALVSGIDTVIGVEAKDPFAISFSCFLFAFLTSALCSLFFSIKIKGKSLGSRTIDPNFNHIRFIRKKELNYHLLAGFGNAIMTIGTFSLFPILNYDPAVVLPFSEVSILYLLIAESVTEKDVPTLIEIQSAIIVTFGAILGSISLRGSITIEAFAIVFFIINPGWMIFTFYQRKLKLMKIKEKQNDAINIRVWNVIFSLMFTSIILLIYDIFSKSNHLYKGLLISIDQFKFKWMFLMSFCTFFSLVLYIRALGIGKASIAQAIRASVIVFSIPVTVLLSYYGYTELSVDPVLILIRAMGIILMMLGIVTFTLTLTKAYVFIKMKTGYPIEETMKKLWNIKGITRVAAIAGEYDFIVKVHIRTLVKGYERILEKIQSIPGIKYYRWQSVLKEWEAI